MAGTIAEVFIMYMIFVCIFLYLDTMYRGFISDKIGYSRPLIISLVLAIFYKIVLITIVLFLFLHFMNRKIKL
jgi:hypothetical protein